MPPPCTSPSEAHTPLATPLQGSQEKSLILKYNCQVSSARKKDMHRKDHIPVNSCQWAFFMQNLWGSLALLKLYILYGCFFFLGGRSYIWIAAFAKWSCGGTGGGIKKSLDNLEHFFLSGPQQPLMWKLNFVSGCNGIEWHNKSINITWQPSEEHIQIWSRVNQQILFANAEAFEKTSSVGCV